ncbi:MAG: hypothetical protein NZ749_14880, partial [bacterium]|nr:hypothetical protein [bacterium]
DTAQPRTVQVELRAPDGVRTQTVAVPAHHSTAVHWAYEAKTVGTQKFTLVARELNGQLRDAEERVIEIHPRSVYEVDTRTLLLDREHTLTLTLRPDAQRERTTLTVETIPGVSALIAESLNYLIDYPYGCVEQTVSRFVPAVIAQRVLEAAGTPIDPQTRSKLAAVLEQSLQRLQRLQTEEGGWG